MRRPGVDVHLEKLRRNAERVAENTAVQAMVSVAKTAVSIFLGGIWEFSSEVGEKFLSRFITKRYVPPIYDLQQIEADFDRVMYPHREA